MQLPSGLQLAISRDALFDHGGNWFKCPEGHFWHWIAAPEMGPPPYDHNAEVTSIAQHAPVPTNREEVKLFIRVLELDNSGMYAWGGEWLSLFPRHIDLDDSDLAAWNAWIDRPEINKFLDDTIAECQRLAEVSKRASGYAYFEGTSEPSEDGWISGNLRIPMDKDSE